jgi:hypothetical protein
MSMSPRFDQAGGSVVTSRALRDGRRKPSRGFQPTGALGRRRPAPEARRAETADRGRVPRARVTHSSDLEPLRLNEKNTKWSTVSSNTLPTIISAGQPLALAVPIFL